MNRRENQRGAEMVASAVLAQHVSAVLQRWHKSVREAGGTLPDGAVEHAAFYANLGLAGASVRLTEAHAVSMLDGASVAPHGVRTEPAARELLTLREAADRMRISRSTLTRRLAAGDLTPVRHGGVVRLRTADVDAFLAGGQS